MTRKADLLRSLLTEHVTATRATAILFSGGLDTSILAAIAAGAGHTLQGVMVSVADGPGLDEPYARAMANHIGLELLIVRPTLDDLWSRMPDLIRILGTFDPMELRNSVIALTALEAAARRGHRCVLAGDAADELLAGYSFMVAMPPVQLDCYRAHLNRVMRFTTPVIGRALGVDVETPYMAPSVRDFALQLANGDLIGESGGARYGKKILREAFRSSLPKAIIERCKAPMEHGAGSSALKQFVGAMITEGEFQRDRQRILRDDSVMLRDREQYAYYRVYRSICPAPREMDRLAKSCGECHAPIARIDLTYCRTCGAYPV